MQILSQRVFYQNSEDFWSGMYDYLVQHVRTDTPLHATADAAGNTFHLLGTNANIRDGHAPPP